jgi:ribonucleoside-diphosphate reductase alpha chain
LPEAPFDTDFAADIYNRRYKHPSDGGWEGTSRRVASSVMDGLRPTLSFSAADKDVATERAYDLFKHRRALPGGRYLYAAGRSLHQVNNCILLRAEDSREGWAELSYRAEMALMTGAGIGVWYGDLREAGAPIRRTGGVASGPLGKMKMVNDMGRYVMQGGARRSAIWAGLPWDHPDIFDFITVKDYSDEVKALKERDWTFPAPMDTTNISVGLNDAFFDAYSDPSDPRHEHARLVYDTAVSHMLKHGEPGFTIDTGDKSDEVLRNACTEITSADDSDVCNLGSLVLPRFESPKAFGEAVRTMVTFLTAGSVYSDIPYEKVREVRDANRRLGLGLIGVHEFLMKSGVRYGTDEAFEVLDPYMAEYGRALEYAHEVQDSLGLSLSRGATAIAPNGTIGIVAESTPSADPMFSAAELREVKSANVHGPDQFTQHVVIDPVAQRLVREGVDPSLIEDAYSLAETPQRRFAMTAYLQRYVDHAISGTVNLPSVVTDRHEAQQFGQSLMRYLPQMRGITVYPDGARAGQPRTSVDLEWALDYQDAVAFTDDETCGGGVCGL